MIARLIEGAAFQTARVRVLRIALAQQAARRVNVAERNIVKAALGDFGFGDRP